MTLANAERADERLSSPMLTRLILAAIGTLAFVAAGCGAGTGSTGGAIDGWLVGPPTVCRDRVVTANNVEVARGRCEDIVAAAAMAFAHRDPGHAAVAGMQLHQRVPPPNTAGGLQFVAVYTLADGSVRAIGVGWPGVSTTPFTIDYGP